MEDECSAYLSSGWRNPLGRGRQLCSGLFNFCVPGEAFHPRAVVARHLTIPPKLLFLASPGAIPTAELVYLADLLAVAGWTVLLLLVEVLVFHVVESGFDIFDGVGGEIGNFDSRKDGVRGDPWHPSACRRLPPGALANFRRTPFSGVCRAPGGTARFRRKISGGRGRRFHVQVPSCSSACSALGI